MSDIVGVKGDTESYDLTIVDAEGEAIDLTGSELWFTIKVNQADTDAAALVQKTSGSGITHADEQDGDGAGLATVALEPEDTEKLLARDYYYDVQMKSPAGAVTTVVAGTFTLSADVTRSTS